MRGIGRVRERFAAAVAGRRHVHEARVELVLHVAFHDAVLDEHRAIGRRAFIVDRERAATSRKRAVVDDRDARRRNLFAEHARERRRALAIEIAFETVADRFVQQHAGPARAEHDGHVARGRIDRLEIDERDAYRFAREAVGAPVFEQFPESITPAAARAAGFATAVLLGDHLHVDAHERANIRRERAVGPPRAASFPCSPRCSRSPV